MRWRTSMKRRLALCDVQRLSDSHRVTWHKTLRSREATMPSTITEKILARAAGLRAVRAGDDIRAKPDFVLAYDFPSSSDVLLRYVTDEFGVKRVLEPERFGLFIDHM